MPAGAASAASDRGVVGIDGRAGDDERPYPPAPPPPLGMSYRQISEATGVGKTNGLERIAPQLLRSIRKIGHWPADLVRADFSDASKGTFVRARSARISAMTGGSA
jgi:hypothetical protein